MLWIIVAPFVAIVLAIGVVRIVRRFKQLDELRQQQRLAQFEATHRRPSDDFHDQVWLPLCEQVAQLARQRLGRPLAKKERRFIWRSRTPMVLEIALREIPGAASPQDVVALLECLPQGVDRSDPTGWCNRDT